jgi:hypothetical protein
MTAVGRLVGGSRLLPLYLLFTAACAGARHVLLYLLFTDACAGARHDWPQVPSLLFTNASAVVY